MSDDEKTEKTHMELVHAANADLQEENARLNKYCSELNAENAMLRTALQLAATNGDVNAARTLETLAKK